MCLTITISASGGVGADTRQELAARFPRLLDRGSDKNVVHLHACDLLSEAADWNAPTWILTPDGRETLLAAIAAIFANARGEIEVAALWGGDRAAVNESVSRAELLLLVERDGLGTKTRYRVKPSEAAT